jgi:hypothetical protein
MNFRPELAAKVMRGDKTVTRRRISANPRSPWWRGRCALVIGKDYAVCPGRGERAIGRVTVLSISAPRLGDVEHMADEIAREGFASRVEFIAAWEQINGSYDPDEIVWRVEFAVSERA